MQAACRLHAGCMQPACSLLHPACRMLQPATSCIRSYAGCMKPAWSLHAGCNLLHATCCNLQPPAYDRIHKERDNRHSFSSIPTCRASTPTCRASTPARPSNQSEFYDVASFILCSPNIRFSCHIHDSRTAFHQCKFDRAQIATLNFLSQSRQANCFSLNWILWLDINNIYGLMTLSTFSTSTQKCEIFSYWFIICVSKKACKSQTD